MIAPAISVKLLMMLQILQKTIAKRYTYQLINILDFLETQ